MENEKRNDNSRLVLAFVLIGIGVFWILRKLGFYIDLPDIHWHKIFYPISNMFHKWSHIIFSWPMVMIIVGLILTAGKRTLGIVFLVIGTIFLLPKLFFFPAISISLLLPVALIGVGVAIVLKRI